MKSTLRRIALSVALLSFSSVKAQEKSVPDFGFPEISPISDADPSDRHSVSVKVPTELKVSKDAEFLTVTPSGFERIELTVGKKMATGILIETKMRHGTESTVLSIVMQSTVTWDDFTRGKKVAPKIMPNTPFSIEYTVTLFETDIPSQHFWQPKSGKAYKELWTHTFSEPIK
jgi:hypothetical protein